MVVLSLISLVALAAPAPTPPDTARLGPVCRSFTVFDGPRIWPGFHPESIAVAYVVPDRGTLLCNWRGPLPAGFVGVDASGLAWIDVTTREAANTNAELAGRAVAQLVADGAATPARLLYLSAHEAFHVFERSHRRPGRRFGGGENSFLVTSYPVFNADNEAGFALEARILAAALAAAGDSAAQALAWQFLALRDARQRALGAELAEFEVMAELNEGLAEYAGLRAVESPSVPASWRAGAVQVVAGIRAGLDSVTTQSRISFRLRFYATGPALGRLLDRLAGERWREELVRHDRTIQDELALVTGYAAREARLVRAAETRFDWPGLKRATQATVATLQAVRRAQMDSILGAPGLELVIDASAIGGVGLCGIDPQNLLQAGEGVLLHRRWVRPCAGAALESEFGTPVVQDEAANTLRAVVGADSAVHWTTGATPLAVPDGADLALVRDLGVRSDVVSVRAARAALERHGRTVTVRLLAGQ